MSQRNPRHLWLPLVSAMLFGMLVGCSPSAPPLADAPPTSTVLDPAPTVTTIPPSPTETVPSATPTAAEVTDGANTLIEVSGVEAVIFAAQNAANQGLDLWFNVPAEDYWTPSEEEVVALEEGLAAYLQEEAGERYPRIWQELPTYKRQYAGVVVEGEREILGVFFCASNVDFFEDWEERVVAVDDGGDCFFELRYNPATDTFHDLSVHGEA